MRPAERLKQLHVRFYPPSITLEVEVGGELTERIIDLQVDGTTDVDDLADRIIAEEPSMRPAHHERLAACLERIVHMQGVDYNTFEVERVHKAHAMPLTD
jgi:hypothetical protein